MPTLVARREGYTVSQLRHALSALPDDALVIVMDSASGATREHTVRGARVGFGYDKSRDAIETLLLEI